MHKTSQVKSAMLQGVKVLDLSRLLGGSLIIDGPVPATIYGGVDFEAWKLFNGTLRDLMSESQLTFIDFANIMAAERPLSGVEIFDETHISTTFAGSFIKSISHEKVISYG